jgi:hypothetical protein
MPYVPSQKVHTRVIRCTTRGSLMRSAFTSVSFDSTQSSHVASPWRWVSTFTSPWSWCFANHRPSIVPFRVCRVSPLWSDVSRPELLSFGFVNPHVGGTTSTLPFASRPKRALTMP